MAVSKNISVGFISLGCAKNVVDAEVMAGMLLDDGITLAARPEEADVIIVNTCAFIEEAREETATAIMQACAHKASGGCRGVIVTGCFSQRYNERLPPIFPEVDAFVGVDQIDCIATLVRRVASGEQGVVQVSAAPKRLFIPTRPALSFSGGPFSWLKIAEGCDRTCAFCAIPAIRGRFRSRAIDSLVKEAAAMLQAGSRELNIISQDTAAFGHDRRERGALEVLLRELDALDGHFWIRALYLYPSLLSDALLATIAAGKHICQYFDVPVQHSHPAILRAMRRADTIGAVTALPQRIRSFMPQAVLRTTLLVGFPGERHHHFNHVLDYLQESRFDHVGVFVFSPEEGTAAFEMDAMPSRKVALRRQQQLLEAQKAIVREKRRGLKGSQGEALLLQQHARGLDGVTWRARLARQAAEVDGVTYVRGLPEGMRAGTLVKVVVSGGRGYDLHAVPAVAATAGERCAHEVRRE